ncbi:MAG: hypothetical protein Q4E75_04025 [bacterium]|nr:hypothetical protein [bacterium]
MDGSQNNIVTQSSNDFSDSPIKDIVEKKRLENQKNINNDTQAVKTAADIASKTSNPYAKAIGTAIKTADKFSDGKASKKLGKDTNKVLKRSPFGAGKIAPGLINKTSGNGTESRIGQALSKRKSNTNNQIQSSSNLSSLKNNVSTTEKQQDQIENESPDGGGVNYTISKKILKVLAIISIPVFVIVIFICLLVASSQVVRVAIGIGSADSVAQDPKEFDSRITRQNPDDYYNDPKDENAYINTVSERDLKFVDSKLNNSNLKFTTVKYRKRKYQEAEINEIGEFFPGVSDYVKSYDEDLVYDFFYKLYTLYKTYRDTYNVYLDIPLLMSTLQIQSTNYNEIFESNLDDSYRNNTPKSLPIAEMDFYKDWNGYISTPNSSTHDMEILAQHMVNVEEYNASDSKCTESIKGNCYYIDYDKYDEFLKEFIEKKYYLEESIPFTTNEAGSYFKPGNVSIQATSFTKFNLTELQLIQIANVCAHEQSGAEGAAAEASLMANRYELLKSSSKYKTDYSTIEEGLYNYVKNSGWWAHSPKNMNDYIATTDQIEAVRAVLVYGKRTLPRYVDEHDCIYCGRSGYDIISATNNGVKIDRNDKSKYQKWVTILKNRYGSTYTFYSFPTKKSDPFGYTSEKTRQTYGECYYNFSTGNAVGCGSSAFTTDFITWLLAIADDDTHGYSQPHRRSLIDFDCSSLVYFGLINNGFNTLQLGSYPFTTSSMGKILKSVGFEEIPFQTLSSDRVTTTYLQAGDILVAPGKHTEVYIGEGLLVGAHGSEHGTITGDFGDQTGKEISAGKFWDDGWTYVYRYGGI